MAEGYGGRWFPTEEKQSCLPKWIRGPNNVIRDCSRHLSMGKGQVFTKYFKRENTKWIVVTMIQK